MITEITMKGWIDGNKYCYIYFVDKYKRTWYFNPYHSMDWHMQDPTGETITQPWTLCNHCQTMTGIEGWENDKPSDEVIERYNTHFKDHPNTCTCCRDLI